MASGLGFEPRLLGPKPSVLPLDDPEITDKIVTYNVNWTEEAIITLT